MARSKLTRGQLLRGAGAAGALLAAGRWVPAAAQTVPNDPVGVRPIHGRLRFGQTATYPFFYPGDQTVWTIQMEVIPDGAAGRAGFKVFNPTGSVQVVGGAQNQLQPNVQANVVSVTRGTYVVQVYNDNPGLTVDYWIRVLPGRLEGQPVPAAAGIGAAARRPMIAYVGCYTTPDRQGHGKGIEVYVVDPATGGLSHAQSVETAGNPSFLAVDPTQRFLYAIHGGNVSQVSAWMIDATTGKISFVNSQSSNGTNPVYPAVSADGAWVLVANYTGGTIAAYPVNTADGSLGQATDVVKHSGQLGPNTARQEAPHPHEITWDPAGRFVFVPDLGLDKVLVYRFDQTTGKFAPNDPPFAELPPGSGPRHIAFHPSGAYAYTVNELGNTIAAFAYDGVRGALRLMQVLTATPPDFKGDNAPAEVVVAPSGQFVYGSNRGHDSIGVWAIDQASGLIAPVGWTPIQGKTPRNFNIDPTGSWLYAEGQDSDTIAVFGVDASSGVLTPTGEVEQTGSPVSLVFGGA